MRDTALLFARALETLCNISLEEAAQQVQDRVYQGTERALVRKIDSLVVGRSVSLKSMTREIASLKSDLF